MLAPSRKKEAIEVDESTLDVGRNSIHNYRKTRIWHAVVLGQYLGQTPSLSRISRPVGLHAVEDSIQIVFTIL